MNKIMANWDKLNNEFDALIDNMTADDWKKWQTNRSNKREMRKIELTLKAKIREEKLYFKNFDGEVLTTQKVVASESSTPRNVCVLDNKAGEYDYAMAA